MTSRSDLMHEICENHEWTDHKWARRGRMRERECSDAFRVRVARMLIAAAATHDEEQARMRGDKPRLEVVR